MVPPLRWNSVLYDALSRRPLVYSTLRRATTSCVLVAGGGHEDIMSPEKRVSERAVLRGAARRSGSARQFKNLEKTADKRWPLRRGPRRGLHCPSLSVAVQSQRLLFTFVELCCL